MIMSDGHVVLYAVTRWFIYWHKTPPTMKTLEDEDIDGYSFFMARRGRFYIVPQSCILT